MIENVIEVLVRSLSATQQIGENPRVNRARACAHHQPFKRAEAHGGIDTSTSGYGSQRTPVSQVAGDNLQRGKISSEQLGCASRAVGMIDPVEPIAPDVSLVPTVGTGIDLGC